MMPENLHQQQLEKALSKYHRLYYSTFGDVCIYSACRGEWGRGIRISIRLWRMVSVSSGTPTSELHRV